MAHKPRVEFEGALYHVIVRGNHRRDIFRGASDRVAYLARIERYRERHRCIVYAYVLMSNHVHFLIETGALGFPRSHWVVAAGSVPCHELLGNSAA
jgi:putative transposase